MQDDEYKYRAYFPGWLLRYFPAGKTNQIERAELSASLPPRTMWKSWICSMVWSDLGCNLVRSPGPDIKTELSGRPGLRIHRSWSTRTHCTVDSYWGSPIHLPVTPAWPVTSESCPLPLEYSSILLMMGACLSLRCSVTNIQHFMNKGGSFTFVNF